MAEAEQDLLADIAIVGGGMVGMGCALAMAQAGMKVVLLEAQPISQFMVAAPVATFDDRTLVVNPASMQFWQSVGVWQQLESKLVPIKKVNVSNQGQFGVVNFCSEALGVPELGMVVGAKDLVDVLWKLVNSHEHITIKTSAKLQSFKQNSKGVDLTVQQKEELFSLKASLMVAADGAKSHVRQQLCLDTEIKSYDRVAIVCNAQFSRHHKGCAYERLTPSGPLALLPFHHGRCGLVWSVNSDKATALLELNDEDFMVELQHQLSYRMGKLTKLGRRSSYPIYQVKVPNQISQSVVLMGNAAHAVSPVSAQGLNLAVRGIDRLVKVLSAAKQSGKSLSGLGLLEAYQNKSQRDQEATMNYTDDLMTWFQIDSPWVNGIRSAGLLAADAVPAIKKHLFERAGGLKA